MCELVTGIRNTVVCHIAEPPIAMPWRATKRYPPLRRSSPRRKPGPRKDDARAALLEANEENGLPTEDEVADEKEHEYHRARTRSGVSCFLLQC